MSILKAVGITAGALIVLFVYTMILLQILRQTGIPSF